MYYQNFSIVHSKQYNVKKEFSQMGSSFSLGTSLQKNRDKDGRNKIRVY